MAFRLMLALVCLGFVVFLFGWVLGSEVDWKSPQIQQGAIAALVVIAGWLVTFAFREGTVIIDRLEMGRDVLAALIAEIEDFRDTLSFSQEEADACSEELESLTLSTVAGAEPYFPFFASIAPVLVANRFSGELRALPHACVTPVVQFYATYADLQVMLDDIRSDPFKALSTKRRLLMYQDFVATRLQLGFVAAAAIKSMEGAMRRGLMGQLGNLESFSLGRALGVRKHHD